jgi:hypothetical protein
VLSIKALALRRAQFAVSRARRAAIARQIIVAKIKAAQREGLLAEEEARWALRKVAGAHRLGGILVRRMNGLAALPELHDSIDVFTVFDGLKRRWAEARVGPVSDYVADILQQFARLDLLDRYAVSSAFNSALSEMEDRIGPFAGWTTVQKREVARIVMRVPRGRCDARQQHGGQDHADWRQRRRPIIILS